MYYARNRYGKREKSRIKPLSAAKKAEIIATIKADDVASLEDILESGVIPDLDRSIDDFGRNSVLYACKTGGLRCLRLLHERGASIAPVQGICPFPNWNLPIHVAASAGQADIVKELISLGVKVDARNLNEETPLFCSSNPVCSELLIRAGADPNAHDSLGNTPLALSIRRGDTGSVRLLLKAGADPLLRTIEHVRPGLFWAAGRLHGMEGLFDETVKGVLDRIREGESSGFLDYMDAELHRFSVAERQPFSVLLRTYLEIGGDPHIRDFQGRTLFHHAVKHRDAAGITALVEKNAPIDAQDREHKTALHYVIREAEAFDCFKALVDGGADAEIRSGKRMTVKEELNFGIYRKWFDYLEERDALQASCCAPSF